MIAQRQTLPYLLRKRIVRHKWKVMSTAVLIAVAMALASWSYVNVQRQRARADTEMKIADAVNHFLLERLLTANDPAVAKGSNLTLRELLDRAAAEAGNAFADQPLVEAQVRTTIGQAYRNLAQRDAAPPQLHRAWRLYERAYGVDDPRTLAAEADYAMALESDYRFAEAQVAQERLLERSRRILGERHPDTLMCLHRLANIAAEQGDFKTAEPLFRRSLAARLEVLGPDHPDTLWSMSDLGAALSSTDRAAEAEPLLREALTRRLKVNGPDSIESMNAELNLACALVRLDRLDEAEPVVMNNIATRRRVLGEKHLAVSLPICTLAGMRASQKQFDEAAALADEAFQLRYDADRFETPGTMAALVMGIHALVQAGHVDTARLRLQIADEAVAKAREANQLTSIAGIREYLAALRLVGETSQADAIARELEWEGR